MTVSQESPGPPENERPASEGRLTLTQLREAIATVKAPIYLAAARVLRRVIAHCRDSTAFQLHVPHGDVFVARRSVIEGLVDRDEIGLTASDVLPDHIILIRQPSSKELEQMPADALLRQYWRFVFRGMVRLAAEQRIDRNELSEQRVRCLINDLGIEAFVEIRDTLTREGLLTPSDGLRTALVEATTLFWELHHFLPRSLAAWFPALEDIDHAGGVLCQVINPSPLVAASRPAGAAFGENYEPLIHLEPAQLVDTSPGGEPARPTNQPAAETYHRLGSQAESAAARGNAVRALILWTRARMHAPSDFVGMSRSAIRRYRNRLIHDLLDCVNASDQDPTHWHAPISDLVQRAALEQWSAEARLLFDLQKVCIDRRRGVFRLNLLGWLLTAGRRPLRRAMPHQQEVLILQHLKRARRRLTRVRLSEPHRLQLDGLLRKAIGEAEQQNRARLRPMIHGALEDVHLHPANVPEQVASKKLVEELLDRITERGFSTMGELRDAFARNQLKLHDLNGLGALFRGDQLRRLDGRLSRELDGVHRGGEFYLRWMQSISSIAFATRFGRFLTLYLAVPFGGAYALESGLQHLVHRFSSVYATDNPAAVILLGLFFLGVLNFEKFRVGLGNLFRSVRRTFQFFLVDIPRFIISIPFLRWVFHSAWYRWTYRILIKPAVLTAVIFLIAWQVHHGMHWSYHSWGITYVCVAIVSNSRVGRDIGEITSERLIQLWDRIGLQSLLALFRWLMERFRRALDAIDRILYAVDEWLRFRAGDGPISVFTKTVVSPVWAVVRYIVRFCVTLLIEPQVNPIKHFPVVTVSHKILLPFIPALAGVLQFTLDKPTAYVLATTIIGLIPGGFGFLVWELRENWRLYSANRPKLLIPVPIGPHGETIEHLLVPGFHSGTLPKRYTKLRHEFGRAERTGAWSAVRGHVRMLNAIERSVRRFIERDLIAYLNQSGAWRRPPFKVDHVRASTHRIVVHLNADDGDAEHDSIMLAFNASEKLLITSFAAAGWLDRLDAAQAAALHRCLAGLYLVAGTDIIQERLTATLPDDTATYRVEDDRVVVWTKPACEREIACRLVETSRADTASRASDHGITRRFREIAQSEITPTHLSYDDWVTGWERDASTTS